MGNTTFGRILGVVKSISNTAYRAVRPLIGDVSKGEIEAYGRLLLRDERRPPSATTVHLLDKRLEGGHDATSRKLQGAAHLTLTGKEVNFRALTG